MKGFLGTYLISYLAVYLTQIAIRGFDYGPLLGSTYVLLVLGLAIAQSFLYPMVKILGLPTKGLGGLLLRTILSGLVFYIFTSALQGFAIVSTFLPAIKVLDITLPSRNLSSIESLVALALTYSIISSFLVWLYKSKR